jgi:autotransporter-associated beta strand protein
MKHQIPQPSSLQNVTFARLHSVVIALTLAATPAWPASLFWDGTDTTANADGGAGIWNTTNTNWDDAATGGANTAWGTSGNIHTANFGGVGGTVTLGYDMGPSGAYPNAINVTAGNYVFDLNGLGLAWRGTGLTISSGATLTIQNGTVTLLNTGFTVSGTNALTISAKVTEASAGTAFSKLGAGDITLTNNANDFTGKLYGQNGGTVSFSSIADSGVASAAGAGSIVETGFNNTMRYTGGAASTNRTFSLVGGGASTLKNDGTGALVWAGAFTNTKTDANTLNLGGSNTGANDFQGAIINSTNAGQALSINKQDAGTWILSGANTYTGTTTLSAGTLRADAADVAATSGALGNGGDITFSGGTLQYTAASAGTDYSARIKNSTTGGGIKIDTNGQNVTFGSALISSNNAGLTKEGVGQLELKMSAAAQYTGTTTINGGTLRFAGKADLDGISSSTININNGASLVIYSDFNRTTLSNGKTFTFGSTGGGSIVYDKGNHLWQSSAGKFVTTGGTQNTISSANGGFINPQGSNTVNFDIADGSDAIDLLVSVTISSGNYTKSGAGTMSITSSSTLGGGGVSQPNLTINAGTFDVGGSARLTTSGQTTGVVTSDILNNGVYSHSSSGAQMLSGVISGSGSLIKSNSASTLTLSAANSYTGTTTVSAGSVILSNGTGKTGTGDVTVQNGGTLLGTGVIQGSSFTAQSGSTVQAGDTTAQSSFGTLTFTPVSGSGSFDFQSGSSVILGINPGGTSDLLNFVGTGTNTLLFNGNLTIGPASFTPTMAETFNLLDWAGLASAPTFASRYSSFGLLTGNGDEAAGLDLPNISGSGFFWDFSQFTTSGSIAIVVPEPSRALLLMAGAFALMMRRRRFA